MSKNRTVNADQFADAILQDLKEFNQEAADLTKEICKAAAEECKQNLRKNSPKGKSKKHYRSGWNVTVLFENNSTVRLAVHNRKKPGLVHLLENGHALKNGGRARAFPHVKPEQERLEKELPGTIKKRFKAMR